MNAVTETRNQPPRAQQQEQRQQQSDRGFVIPPANISDSGNEYLLELDMPGVNKEGLQITIESNELTIIGRRQLDSTPGELVYCESGLADYRRVFEVGPDIDSSKISADIKNGVLRVHLPRSERAKPRQIEVQFAE